MPPKRASFDRAVPDPPVTKHAHVDGSIVSSTGGIKALPRAPALSPPLLARELPTTDAPTRE